jgi:hypothetical protein
MLPPVGWVRHFGESVLALFAPNGLQKAPWGETRMSILCKTRKEKENNSICFMLKSYQ